MFRVQVSELLHVADATDRDSLMRWVKASVRIREAKALMTSFVDVRTEGQ